MHTVGNIAFVGMVVGAVTFMAIYSTTSRWWRNAPGRYVWTFGAVMVTTLVLAAIRLVYGSLPYPEFIRAIINIAFTGLIWGAVVALIRVQILRRRATKNN